MKILHTADLHLGAALGAEKRFDEFDALLDRLVGIIREEGVKAVIIAGDVFDTHIPSNRAAEQYYRFLMQAAKAGAEKIIVTGGNHDSPAYLEAPKEVLKLLDVHVIAAASEDCRDMIIPLEEKGKTAALVGAVPYLREKDLVIVGEAQSLLERENTLRTAVLEYYRKMAQLLKDTDPHVPHIMTGHLFVTEGSEHNDSWVGTLMSIAAGEFPDSVDYLALGHLHDAHTLKSPHKTVVRYPGAPVNVSFRELKVSKSVTLIDTEDVKNYREIPLPPFQEMRMISGTVQEIEAELEKLVREDNSVWCSVENTGEYEPALVENLQRIVKDSKVLIIKYHNLASNPAVIQRLPSDRKLDELAPIKVFELMLDELKITENTDELLAVFNEIETAVRESEKI